MNSNLLRFIAFLFIIVCICLTPFCFVNKINLKDFNAFNIKFYYSSNVEIDNEKTYKNGIGFYVAPNIDNVKNYLSKNNFDGIEFSSTLPVNEILSKINAKIVKKQKISIKNEEKTIIYAFTNKFNKFVTLENKKINVQIVLTNQENKIGLPLLLGSY